LGKDCFSFRFLYNILLIPTGIPEHYQDKRVIINRRENPKGPDRGER